MSIYLSIDLDFWNQGRRSFKHCKNFLTSVKRAIPTEKLKLVDSHEELLPFVDSSGCTELINVDWHSDIVNVKDPVVLTWENWQKFNCGTWINFVKFQSEGKYTWIHPNKKNANGQLGRCHRPFHRNHNPFYSKQWTDWKEIEEIGSKTPESHIDLSKVTSCGVCFSYKWVRWDLPEICQIATEIFGWQPEENPNALLGY